MPFEDKDISDSVLKVLEGEDIRVLLNANTLSVSQSNGFEIKIESGGGEETLKGSHLLSTAGRNTNANTLNLEAAGIETYGGNFIKVDNHCQTNVDGVFAVDDMNGHGAYAYCG